QHRLLQPLVGRPGPVVAARGDAGLTRVQQGQGLFDRLPHLAVRRRRDIGPVLPGGLDDGFQLGAHAAASLKVRSVRKESRSGAMKSRWSPGGLPWPSPIRMVAMPSALAGSRLRGVSSKKAAERGSKPNRSIIRRNVAGAGLGVRSASSMAKTPSKQSVTP